MVARNDQYRTVIHTPKQFYYGTCRLKRCKVHQPVGHVALSHACMENVATLAALVPLTKAVHRLRATEAARLHARFVVLAFALETGSKGSFVFFCRVVLVSHKFIEPSRNTSCQR